MDRFGPNTEAVEALVARIAALTSDEIRRLGAAWRAARGAAWRAAWDAAGDAARALVTWDLATEHGPYTAAQRDLLAGPWAEVIGLPAELVGG